jgi:hypothetical protein
MKSLTIDQSRENVAAVLVTMKSVKGFKIGKPIDEFVTKMAQLIAAGNNAEAIKQGGEIVSVGRSILGAFIRNSAIDHMKGEVQTTAYFNRQIALRRDEEWYDTDLIDGLVARHAELLEAIKTESAGDFTKRVAAYNAMSDSLTASDAEQNRRDQVRRTLEQAEKVAKSKKGKGDKAEGERKVANAQREAVRQVRQNQADELLNLLK